MKSRILLVEDDLLLREMTKDDLADLGFDALCARDCDDACVMLCSGQPISALITDIRMPGDCDGWELARRARTRRPDLPVIYISGYSGDKQQPVPGSVFLKKPYRLSDVENALAQFGIAS